MIGKKCILEQATYSVVFYEHPQYGEGWALMLTGDEPATWHPTRADAIAAARELAMIEAGLLPEGGWIQAVKEAK